MCQNKRILALCTPRQGPVRPLYPAAGASPLHPPGALPLDPECDIQSYRMKWLSHESLGDEKQHHGHNENRKKAWKEINFLQRLFCCFPRMLCIRLAADRRRPVCASGTSNSQSNNLLLPKGLCVLRRGEMSIPPPLRGTSLYTREVFFFHCFSGILFVR